MWTVFEAGWPVQMKIGCFQGLMTLSKQIWVFLRPDGQSEQILTLGAHACCSLSIFGEIFEISCIHKSQIFGNFHQALPPIFRGPTLVRFWVQIFCLKTRPNWTSATLWIRTSCLLHMKISSSAHLQRRGLGQDAEKWQDLWDTLNGSIQHKTSECCMRLFISMST